MIAFEDIKRAFSKAFVTITSGRVSVRYISTADSRWATQCFPSEGNTKNVLETILDDSDELGIAISPDFGVVLEFLCNGKLLENSKPCSHYPTAHNMTAKELEELEKCHYEEFQQKEIEFARNFAGVDMEDDEAVLEKLSEIIAAQKPNDKLINFKAHSKWSNLRQKVVEFSEKHELGAIDAMPPNSTFSGGVTLSVLLDNGRRTWTFSKDDKTKFLDLIKTSDEVDIECGLTDLGEEVLNISFYS